jgi:hypothetical protein
MGRGEAPIRCDEEYESQETGEKLMSVDVNNERYEKKRESL